MTTIAATAIGVVLGVALATLAAFGSYVAFLNRHIIGLTAVRLWRRCRLHLATILAVGVLPPSVLVADAPMSVTFAGARMKRGKRDTFGALIERASVLQAKNSSTIRWCIRKTGQADRVHNIAMFCAAGKPHLASAEKQCPLENWGKGACSPMSFQMPLFIAAR